MGIRKPSYAAFVCAVAIVCAVAFWLFACVQTALPPETVAASERLAAANSIVGPLIGAPADAGLARVATFSYGEDRRVDIYWPPGFAFDRRVPLVLFIVSISDSRVRHDVGSSAPDLAAYVSWCAAAASQGAAAAVMTVAEPVKDLERLAVWLKKEAGRLRLDTSKVYLWACSSNWSAGSMLAAAGGAFAKELAGISLYYTYVGIMTPTPAKPVPVEVLIPEKDSVGQMKELASYAKRLGGAGCIVKLVNVPGGGHSFDTKYDAPVTRAAVAGTLDAIRAALGL